MRQRSTGVIIRGNKVLVFHRNRQGTEYYVFPGGGVDDGENPDTALAREMQEELGIEVEQSIKLCEGQNDSNSGTNLPSLNQYEHFYLISKWTGEPTYMEVNSAKNVPGNTTQMQWLGIDELAAADNLYPKIVGTNVMDEIRKLNKENL